VNIPKFSNLETMGRSSITFIHNLKIKCWIKRHLTLLTKFTFNINPLRDVFSSIWSYNLRLWRNLKGY
jgi:hypothetical protein